MACQSRGCRVSSDLNRALRSVYISPGATVIYYRSNHVALQILLHIHVRIRMLTSTTCLYSMTRHEPDYS